MRIAVCISGFVRPSHSRLDTFKKHFMDLNSDVDIYSCVWDIDGDSVPIHTIENLRTDHMCIWSGKCTRISETRLDYAKYLGELNSMGARKVIHKVQNYEEYSKKWMTELIPFEIDVYRDKTPYMALSRVSMWHGIKEAFDMIPDPAEYDYIVRSRTDNLFSENIVISKLHFTNETPMEHPHIQLICRIFGTKQPTSNLSVIVPYREHDANKYIDDMFMIGTPESMKILTRVHDRIYYFMKILMPLPFPGIENETILGAHLLQSNVNINIFAKLPSLAKA